VTPLDLGRPRELGEIVGDAFRIFREHAAVFLTLTLVVVAPAGLLVDGVWGRALADGADSKGPSAQRYASLFLAAYLLPTLVTALNVRVVEGLGRGEAPAAGAALRRAAPVVLPTLLVVAVAGLGVAAGLVALIVPGVYLAVAWFFAAQVVVLEGVRGPGRALGRSRRLVSGLWGHVLVRLLVSGLLFSLVGAAVQVLGAAGGSALYVAGLIVGQAIALSLTAIAGTLLYFDVRARQGEPWRAAAS
jgi:hypothetical protein